MTKEEFIEKIDDVIEICWDGYIYTCHAITNVFHPELGSNGGHREPSKVEKIYAETMRPDGCTYNAWAEFGLSGMLGHDFSPEQLTDLRRALLLNWKENVLTYKTYKEF